MTEERQMGESGHILEIVMCRELTPGVGEASWMWILGAGEEGRL